MLNDPLPKLVLIFATIVRQHGVEEALIALPLDVQQMIYHYFYNGIQANNINAPKS